MGLSRGKLALHLSVHHGDASPGATLHVPKTGIEAFQQELAAQAYKYGRPGIVLQDWGLEMTVHDPFGNRIRFGGEARARPLTPGLAATPPSGCQARPDFVSERPVPARARAPTRVSGEAPHVHRKPADCRDMSEVRAEIDVSTMPSWTSSANASAMWNGRGRSSSPLANKPTYLGATSRCSTVCVPAPPNAACRPTCAKPVAPDGGLVHPVRGREAARQARAEGLTDADAATCRRHRSFSSQRCSTLSSPWSPC